MAFSRREALAFLTAALCSPAVRGAPPFRGGVPDGTALREAAGAKGLTVGSAISVEQLNPADGTLFVHELSSVTPENALKLAHIRPDREEWNFKGADAIVAFASENRLAIRGHTLIWNNDEQPAWLNSLSARELESVIDEHIERTMSRYAGRIAVWDVVNEPVGDTPYGRYLLRDGPFAARLGPDYIARSFRRARSVDAAVRLCLNETHTERDDDFGLNYRKMLLFVIDQLQEAGVPLDGIGLQGHLEPDKPFDPEAFEEFLSEIARRRLVIEITELDVNDRSFADDVHMRDKAVAETYRRFLDAALSSRAVKSVTFWQLSDGASYYYERSVREEPKSLRRPRPLLYDIKMRPKPARVAVLASLERMPAR